MLENFISTFLGFSYVHTFQHKTKEANTVFSYYKYRNDNNNLNNYHVDAVQLRLLICDNKSEIPRIL